MEVTLADGGPSFVHGHYRQCRRVPLPLFQRRPKDFVHKYDIARATGGDLRTNDAYVIVAVVKKNVEGKRDKPENVELPSPRALFTVMDRLDLYDDYAKEKAPVIPACTTAT